MKRHPLLSPRLAPLALAAGFLAWLPGPSRGQEEERRDRPGDAHVSLKLEIERSMERGLAWLLQQQDAESGAWGDPEQPALTALPVMAIMGDPARDPREPLPEAAARGYAHLLASQQADGGIYAKGLATYNTALAVTALTLSGEAEHLSAIARARRFLVGLQQDHGTPGQSDNILDGGIGYGGSYTHSDLSNTHLALEALYWSKQVLSDTAYDNTREVDLDWDAAIAFVSRCQNTEATVAKLGAWAGLREEDKGGFVYFPGDTKSDEIPLEGDRVALRSYGSMSYAGLLSFIYAEMPEDDPRVAAALEWLGRNYTVEENPGLDAQGLFYYYHTMAKALALSRRDHLELPDGNRADWRKELALRIFEEQQRDGSWVNQGSKRWMEDDPVLVTSYALLALAHIHRML